MAGRKALLPHEFEYYFNNLEGVQSILDDKNTRDIFTPIQLRKLITKKDFALQLLPLVAKIPELWESLDKKA